MGYFPYEIMHKKWQYHLLGMLKEQFGDSVKKLIDELWKKYPQGFVGHVSKGKAPEHSKGLAKYLAKYVASPPISNKRISQYDGEKEASPEVIFSESLAMPFKLPFCIFLTLLFSNHHPLNY